ncbi:phage tail protein [Saccharothrix sp. NRRL B-16348]|jgi:phage tail-like protein|uniref:phage tail protein n=1 Tax=Saccharothrix sp. NRRL B-16348 TaxID=1415542 RepID=UPI0006AFE6C6|nr:phage tail protein [Saccharothrix sp. NRRL B-16348]KOX18759.1 phage tail protein [Saccharothrix sp. NRRL B-16348]
MAGVDEAVSVCFVVRIDDESLGSFNSCDGLGVEFTVEQREEGGNNGMVWQLPTRIKYSNVKLTRPVTKDSAKIIKWIAGMAAGVKRKTAIIEARTLDGTVIASWALSGVIPVRWSGPQLTADSPKVATETLELAHHGFLSTAR